MTGPVFVKEVRNHPFPYDTYVNLDNVEEVRLDENRLYHPVVITITGKKKFVDFSDLLTPGDVDDD